MDINKYFPLISALLDKASDQFSNHGCNDFDLTELFPNVADRQKLNRLICYYHNDWDDYNETDDFTYSYDWVLMDVFSKLLSTEVNKMGTYTPDWIPNVVNLLNALELSNKTKLKLYDLVANYVEQEEIYKQCKEAELFSNKAQNLNTKLDLTKQKYKALQQEFIKSLAVDYINSFGKCTVNLSIDYFDGFKFLLTDVCFEDEDTYYVTYKVVYVEIGQTKDYTYTTDIQLI